MLIAFLIHQVHLGHLVIHVLDGQFLYTEIFMVQIILNCIKFKLFVTLRCHMRFSFTMSLLYHAYACLGFLILACTIYILAPMFIRMNKVPFGDCWNWQCKTRRRHMVVLHYHMPSSIRSLFIFVSRYVLVPCALQKIIRKKVSLFRHQFQYNSLYQHMEELCHTDNKMYRHGNQLFFH